MLVGLVHLGPGAAFWEIIDSVERAAHTPAATVENVGVDHGGAHVPMSQEFLDRADVLPALQQMCGERVSQGVRAGRFCHLSAVNGRLEGLL